jgi:glycosyltransferase involved in cell wall biosynthesis
VVDDGSSDATVARAVDAGADVLRLGRHAGLGAAVRHGLREGVRTGAAAIAFCDADGEYAPEELDRLVGPVLDGTADYVVGSRFAGLPRRMAPHRWLGNRLLTTALGLVVGRRLTDGQSGYRALSPAAAADAVIAHDFNYAQVLTQDLLGKGYRYREMPISYRFRTMGRSFVRPVQYLRTVVPVVLRLRLLGPGPHRVGDRDLADGVLVGPGRRVLEDGRLPQPAPQPLHRAPQRGQARLEPLEGHVAGQPVVHAHEHGDPIGRQRHPA